MKGPGKKKKKGKAGPGLQEIAASSAVREGKSLKFTLQRQDRETEAFVVRKDGRLHSYLNLCRHWTVGLDFDDNEFFSEDGQWLVCKNHGAVYHPGTGVCESGPCGGAALYRVPLVEKGGVVYADLEGIDWGEA